MCSSKKQLGFVRSRKYRHIRMHSCITVRRGEGQCKVWMVAEKPEAEKPPRRGFLRHAESQGCDVRFMEDLQKHSPKTCNHHIEAILNGSGLPFLPDRVRVYHPPHLVVTAAFPLSFSLSSEKTSSSL